MLRERCEGRSDEPGDGGGAGTTSTAGSKGMGFKPVLRSTFHLCSHLILYHLGYVMPKEGRPQTVIVVARKGKDF